MLYDQFGYDEINLNAGCPSGTVVSKDKGSGMLKNPDTLERILYEILSDNYIIDNHTKYQLRQELVLKHQTNGREFLQL